MRHERFELDQVLWWADDLPLGVRDLARRLGPGPFTIDNIRDVPKNILGDHEHSQQIIITQAPDHKLSGYCFRTA